MRIGITGGCGYVASTLAPLLTERAERVELIDLKSPLPSVTSMLDPKIFHYVNADVSDERVFREIAPRYDVVIHLAALVGYPACENDPQLAHRFNVKSTENVVRFKRKDAKLIFSSTISVYGDQADGSLVNEDSVTRPNSIYGKTKKTAEDLVLSDPKGIVVRFAGSFGYSPKMRHDVLIHDFIRMATQGQKLSIYENAFIRQFVHVRDMVGALLFFLDNEPKSQTMLFNVGNPQIEITKRTLVDEILNICPFPHSFENSGKDLEKRNYRVSFDKLLSAGFLPRMKLRDGIAELVRYYQNDIKKEFANVG